MPASTVYTHMRHVFVWLAVIALAGPAAAQEGSTSSAGGGKSSTADSVSTDALAQDQAELPVSLDRIRDGLKRPADAGLKNLDVKADFMVRIDEQRHIDEILKKLDFKSGPTPAGGLRAYDMQRMLFNPTQYPGMQPYAAFSGGELITIALENLIGKYLGGRALSAVSNLERSRAEASARAEVDTAVADYCAGRPDRDSITLCNRD